MSHSPAGLAVPVETVMTRRIVQILEQIPMSEVRNIAAKYDYNGFPVVTQDGRLVGMVTKGDLLRVACAALDDPEVWRPAGLALHGPRGPGPPADGLAALGGAVHDRVEAPQPARHRRRLPRPRDGLAQRPDGRDRAGGGMKGRARHLDAKLIDEFRRRLLEAREALLRTVAATDEEMAGLEAPAPGDSTDRAATSSVTSLVSRLGGQDKRELDEIADALRRLGSRRLRVLRIVPGAHRAPASSGRARDAVLSRLSGSRGGGSMIRTRRLAHLDGAAGVVRAGAGRQGRWSARVAWSSAIRAATAVTPRSGWALPSDPICPASAPSAIETYLTRWLRDPSAQRPSAHMPKLQLTEAEVQALAAYLGSLR